MSAEVLYTIILEHNLKVLLEAATMEQVESFWDAHDEHYFGLRLEETAGSPTRVIVTDELPDEEQQPC